MKKILVVEDVAEIRRLLRLVSMKRYIVREATNADEALAMLKHDSPDLVTLDINLPGSMNGLQILEAMRADPDLSTTPVVIVSARGSPADRHTAETLGAAAYFNKPFSPLAVSDRIASLLESGQAARRSIEGA